MYVCADEVNQLTDDGTTHWFPNFGTHMLQHLIIDHTRSNHRHVCVLQLARPHHNSYWHSADTISTRHMGVMQSWRVGALTILHTQCYPHKTHNVYELHIHKCIYIAMHLCRSTKIWSNRPTQNTCANIVWRKQRALCIAVVRAYAAAESMLSAWHLECLSH